MAPILQVQDLNYIYSIGTPFQHQALENVSFSVERGEFIGIIGHTGSGKSTLMQQLNGLLKPTSGKILLDGQDIWSDKKLTRQARFRVGLVFQYPEYQLFEETVYKDIAFGPKNMGLKEDEIDRRVREAAATVGLTEEQLQVSPFDLSGGQKRRVAIAGVIAMEPEVLILDEPTAGLDPSERIRFRNLISELSEDRIVLLSTHIVSDVEYIANEILLMQDGQLTMSGTSEEVIASMPEQVWTFHVPKAQIEAYLKSYKVANVKTVPGGAELRVLSQVRPNSSAVEVEPTLEDVFLYYFGESAGDNDGTV